jgi:anti-sigma regulatory factor (Ser/Thr protein kinase)
MGAPVGAPADAVPGGWPWLPARYCHAGVVTTLDAETEFVHPALFYRGSDDYLNGVGGFLQKGLAAGEPAFASIPLSKHAALRDYLGGDSTRVLLFDMGEVGRNPGRIMTALTDFADNRGTGRAWLVGEPIWPARTPAEIREATRHEALINLAFTGVPVTILCPYDTQALPADVLTDAARTHPVLWSAGREQPSDAYVDPRIVDADCSTLDPAPATAETFPFGPPELATTRHRAKTFGSAAGLSEDRAIDLMLAVGEAAANAIRHGGGQGTLALWADPTAVTAEIRDQGRLANPLAGRRRPAAMASGGRGLWLIHQLSDLVELAPGHLRMRFAL